MPATVSSVSGFRGVIRSLHPTLPWQVIIRRSGQPTKYLGPFKESEEAARAYDDHWRSLGLGRADRLNFPRTGERPGPAYSRRRTADIDPADEEITRVRLIAAVKALQEVGAVPSLDRLKAKLPDVSWSAIQRIRRDLEADGSIEIEKVKGLSGRTQAERDEVKERIEAERLKKAPVLDLEWRATLNMTPLPLTPDRRPNMKPIMRGPWQ